VPLVVSSFSVTSIICTKRLADIATLPGKELMAFHSLRVDDTLLIE